MSWKWLGGAVILALAAVACTPVPTTPPSTPPTQQVRERDLTALKQQAGIADCPPAGPKSQAARGGLPDVTLGCLGGGPDVRLPDLTAQVKRPLVINIWAQWCSPCRTEAKFFQQLHERAGGKVAVLGIDHDDPRPDLALELAKVLGLRYPQLADPDKQLRGPFGLAVGLPATVYVDQNGRVAHIAHVAYKSQDALYADVARYLGVRP